VKPVLLVRCDEFESFGVAPGALVRAGLDVRTVNMTDPDVHLPRLEDVSGVITFGGTSNVDQIDLYPYLGLVRDHTRACLSAGLPYLGICLGAQVLARVLGQPVFKAPVREFGFEPLRLTPEGKEDPLLSVYVDGDDVFQWHEDTFELPDGAELLATGDGVRVQAYRVGDAAWGIQFHQEIDGAELEWWLDVADASSDLEREWGKSADAVREESARSIAAHQDRGLELFRRFAEVVRGTPGASLGPTR
jgi:GMP synthase (glutamine-hydrolysing)